MDTASIPESSGRSASCVLLIALSSSATVVAASIYNCRDDITVLYADNARPRALQPRSGFHTLGNSAVLHVVIAMTWDTIHRNRGEMCSGYVHLNVVCRYVVHLFLPACGSINL